MDNDKKNLDELFQYGNRILSRLKTSAEEKSCKLKELETLKNHHENLRQRLKNLLDEPSE